MAEPPNSHHYPFPPANAAHESARLNVQHELSLADSDGALFLSPFPAKSRVSDSPAPKKTTTNNRSGRRLRVADIGTGTAIWAAEFARLNPDMDVFGLDIGSLPDPANLPKPMPPNLHFALQDVQAGPWPSFGADKDNTTNAPLPFDLIHGRQIILNLPNPAAALRQVWNNLRPGSGLVEFREFWNPMAQASSDSASDILGLASHGSSGHQPNKASTDGGSSSLNSASATTPVPLLVEWHRLIVKAAAAINGCDHSFAAKLPDALRAAGFVDIHVVDRLLPLGWVPKIDNINKAKDHREEVELHYQKIDYWLRELVRVGAPVMTGEMFVKGLGWSPEEASAYAERVVAELGRTDLGQERIYVRFRVVWARRPKETLFAGAAKGFMQVVKRVFRCGACT